MRFFRASENNDEISNVNKHNMVKNPKWKAADQLAVYKHGQAFELRATENNTS